MLVGRGGGGETIDGGRGRKGKRTSVIPTTPIFVDSVSNAVLGGGVTLSPD